MIPPFALLYTLAVMLASSTSGGLQSLRLAGHHPVRIGNERERLVEASPLMTKSRGPSWGKQLPGERPRETAKT
jgi:hypothetical protein